MQQLLKADAELTGLEEKTAWNLFPVEQPARSEPCLAYWPGVSRTGLGDVRLFVPREHRVQMMFRQVRADALKGFFGSVRPVK